MSDLRYARDLMRQSKDLGTKLVGSASQNTDNPHVHMSCAARRRQEGPRHRAGLHQPGHAGAGAGSRAQELGPHTNLDIRRSLDNQIDAERWTRLDRQLVRDAVSTASLTSRRI
jgi:type IV secretory pathway VirD2 relaxase